MSMTVGFLTNAAAVTGITTSYDKDHGIALSSSATVAGADSPLPQGVYLDHIEIHCTGSGGTPASFSAWLSWDAAGDSRATKTVTITLEAGLTTSTALSGVEPVPGAWFRCPGQTLTLYLWLKTNANGADVAAAGVRLHWTEAFAGRG